MCRFTQSSSSLLRALTVMRKLDRGDTDNLRRLAAYFIGKEDFGLAGKIYQAIHDTGSLVKMHVEAHHWTDVRKILSLVIRY